MTAETSDKALWDRTSILHPYRASIAPYHEWKADCPSRELAAAERTCSNGRVLLVFEHVATRDYFVEGHDFQGAHIEADNAEDATTYWTDRHPKSLPWNLWECLVLYQQASKRVDSASKTVANAFSLTLREFISRGKHAHALALAMSIPDEEAREACLVGIIDKSGPRAGPKVSWTVEQAEAVRDWQRATLELKPVSHRYQDLLTRKFEQKLERGGPPEELRRLLDSMPYTSAANALRERLPPRNVALSA